MSASILDKLANGNRPIEPEKVSAGVSVIPYNANSDPNSDRFLPWFWNRLKEDGLVSLYFPGAEKTGFATFVKMMSGDVQIMLVVKHDGSDEPMALNTVGFATIGSMMIGGTSAAYAGFIFLKDYWDHHTSTEAADRIMAAWFTQPLDVILGVVADDNVLAKRFLQRIGWVNSGKVPHLGEYMGKQCAATFWYMTREMWEAKR